MSIVDPVTLGESVRIEPEFLYDCVALRVWFRSVDGEWREAWAGNGGRGDVVVPVRVWEEIRTAVGGP